MPYAEGSNAWDAAGLKFPHLTTKIVETPFEGFDMRTLLQYYASPKNNRVVVPIEDGCSTALVNRVAEGSDCPLMHVPFTGQEIICYKIGEGYPITHEMLQYQQAPFVEQMAKHLSWKMRHTVNVDVITAINAGVPLANTIAATGNTLMPGANNVNWIYNNAGQVGQLDLIQAIQLLQQNFKAINEKTILLCNPVGRAALAQLPHYHSENMYGEAGYQKGMMGQIEGCQVVVSNDVPANTMFLIATDPTTWRTGQYTPVGFFVESRPLEALMRQREDRDGQETYSYWEYGIGITYGEGIVKLTYGAVSS